MRGKVSAALNRTGVTGLMSTSATPRHQDSSEQAMHGDNLNLKKKTLHLFVYSPVSRRELTACLLRHISSLFLNIARSGH